MTETFNCRTPLGDLVQSLEGVEIVRLSTALAGVGTPTSFRTMAPLQRGTPASIAQSAAEGERRVWLAARVAELGPCTTFHLAVGFGLCNFKQWGTVRVHPAATASWVFELLAHGTKYLIILSEDQTAALTLLATAKDVRVWVLHEIDEGLPRWAAEREHAEREQQARVRSCVRETLSTLPGVDLRDGEAPAMQPSDLWDALGAFAPLGSEVQPFARFDACPRSWANPSARRDALARWLRASSEKARIGDVCSVSVGLRGAPWEHIELTEPRDCLSALYGITIDGWRDVDPQGRVLAPTIDHLLVLSKDGSRTLAVRTTPEEELQAFLLPTSTLLDRRAARERLDDAIAQVEGVRLVGPSQRTQAIGAQDVFQDVFHAGSLGALASDAWLRQLLGDLDAAARAEGREPPHVPADALGGYELTLGTASPVPWATVFTYDPDWLTTLWDAGGMSHILIRSPEAAVILGVRRVGETYEAFISPTGTSAAAERST
jgi:hypothetical protein